VTPNFSTYINGLLFSNALFQAYREKSVGGSQLDTQVSKVVSYLWTEAMGELDDIVSLPLSSIGNEKVKLKDTNDKSNVFLMFFSLKFPL
jgi:hypothetical protein